MKAHRLTRTKPRPGPIAALLLLCFLWSLGSLRSDLLQNLTLHPLPAMEKQAVPFALLAVTAALFALARRTAWPRGLSVLPPVLVGLGLFVAPAVLVSLAKDWVPELTRVALFSLVPVFAVVLEPYIGHVMGPRTGAGCQQPLPPWWARFASFPYRCRSHGRPPLPLVR